MKRLLIVLVGLTAWLSGVARAADEAPPVYKVTAPAFVVPPPDPEPVAPPSQPVKLGAAELEKLVAPIALYPDPLLGSILPASVYPLEIVQAARFVKDTNNLTRIDAQPWDSNVKAVARFPAVIEKMNTDLSWTIELGRAFKEQPAELMDAIQGLRKKAEQAGTLRSTSQQNVVVTNAVVERTVDQQIVYVTNTVVQIQPVDSQVVYVPQYNPAVVYAPPVGYVYDPFAPLITFGVGLGFGLFLGNYCDWHYGGIWAGGCGSSYVIWSGSGHYHPPYYPPPPGYRPPPYYPPPGGRPPPPGTRPPGYPPPGSRPPAVTPPRPPATAPPGTRPPPSVTPPQRWRPDQSRLQTFGPPTAAPSTRSLDARGWSQGTTTRPTPAPGSSFGTRPSVSPPSSPGFSRPGVSRPGISPSPPGGMTPQPRPSSPSIQRPYQPSPSRGSAFQGMGSGSTARGYSSRGMSSRGTGGYGPGGGGGRGGGGRGGR